MYVLSDLEIAVYELESTNAFISALCARWRSRDLSPILNIAALSFIHGARMATESKKVEDELSFLYDLMK